MQSSQKQSQDIIQAQIDQIIQNNNEIYQITQDLAKARVEGNEKEAEELKAKLDALQSTQSSGMLSIQKLMQGYNESTDLITKIIQQQNDSISGIVKNLR